MAQSTWTAELKNDPSLKHYLRSLAQRKPATGGEMKALARRIRRGERAAVDRVVQAHLGLVVEIARDLITRQRCRILGAMDLIAEGNIALLATARRCGEWESRGFADVAAGRVRARMLTALADEAGRLMGNGGDINLPFIEYQSLVGFVADRELAAQEIAAARELAAERRHTAQVTARSRRAVSQR